MIRMGQEKEEILKNLWKKNLDRNNSKILKKLCKGRERGLKQRDINLTNYKFDGTICPM